MSKNSTIAITREGTQFALRQNDKPITTPGGNVLMLPSQALAEAVAAEWQDAKGKIRARTTPLTVLALTAIDRIPEAGPGMVDALLEYAETDTLCYRSPEPALAERQKTLWDPVLDWAHQRYRARLAVTDTLQALAQNASSIEVLRSVLGGFSPTELAGISILTQIYASLILALSVKEGVTDAEEAFKLSRLESLFQAEQWGEAEEAQEAAAAALQEAKMAQRFLKLLTTGHHHVESTTRTH